MASSTHTSDDLSAKHEIESNYGSEIGLEDEVVLSALLRKIEAEYTQDVHIRPVNADIKNEAYAPQHPDGSASFPNPVRKDALDQDGISLESHTVDISVRQSSVEVEFDENRIAFSARPQGHDSLQKPSLQSSHVIAETEAEEPDLNDKRSPLERFKAKRPLSVTNIVSPAWCEMQYWYSLTKYGRTRRTPAMKQGSSLHKVMEEQTTTKIPVHGVESLVKKVLQEELEKVVTDDVVASVVQKVLDKEQRAAVPVDVAAGLIHKVLEKESIAPLSAGVVSESVHKAMGEKLRIAVPVDVTTKEDAFGLRIWNIIQGLRNLRATGITREMEVWAIVEGEVINGVIDELSYDCPDIDLEAKIYDKHQLGKGTKRKRKVSLPRNQPTVKSLWQSGSPTHEETSAWLGAPHEPRKVYISDIKTRGVGTMPSSEVAFRPTAMQLMLYHRLLSLLASNCVPADTIFERYNLNGNDSFSDEFIAQVGTQDINFPGELVEDTSALFDNEQDAIDELLAHNTLQKLWTLMINEFDRAMPFREDRKEPSPIGQVLRAEYRASGSGSVIGTKTFAYDAPTLDTYLGDIMAWWKGQRMPKGVDIEEAYKCRMCEFAEHCTWRREKVEQSLRKASRNRLRRGERQADDV